MIVQWTRLFELSLRHAFFTDGDCPDFGVVPLGETEETLLDLRTVTKQRGSKLRVYYAETAAGTPYARLDDAVHLYFGLELTRPQFFNYTALPAITAGNLHVYEQDAGPGTVLRHDQVKPTAGLFGFTRSATAAVVPWMLTDVDGRTVLEGLAETVKNLPSDPGGIASASVDRSDLAAGFYTLTANVDGVDVGQRYFKQAGAGSYFAVVHLAFGGARASLPFPAAPTYLLNFAARSDVWTWNVIVDPPPVATELPSYKVADTSTISSVSFTAISLVPTRASNAALQFRSTTALPYRERPIEKLEFKRTGGPASPDLTLMEVTLPSPSINHARSEMFVYV